MLAGEIASELGWQVFDDGAGDYLLPGEQPDALKNQRDFGTTAREILARRAEGRTRFGERVAHHFVRYSRVEIIISLFIAAIAAGGLVLWFNLPERMLLWLGFSTWLTFAVSRALALAALRR